MGETVYPVPIGGENWKDDGIIAALSLTALMEPPTGVDSRVSGGVIISEFA